MSQEKVNQYKEAKKNRKATVAKEKRMSMLKKIGVGIVGAAFVIWIGYSAVVTVQNAEGPAVTVDSTAISDYLGTLEE